MSKNSQKVESVAKVKSQPITAHLLVPPPQTHPNLTVSKPTQKLQTVATVRVKSNLSRLQKLVGDVIVAPLISDTRVTTFG